MSLRTALTARWTKNQDPTVDPPTKVTWNDGSAGTVDDFRKHLVDTHFLEFENGTIKMTMFPHISADVRYDSFAKTWVVYGPFSDPIALELPDRATTDDQIEAQLSVLPIVYRARIHRDPALGVRSHPMSF
jgi:hypothetical protein